MRDGLLRDGGGKRFCQPNRRRFRPELGALERRQVLSASLAPLSNINVLQYQGQQVVLDGSGSNATQQTYTVSSSNPDIGASVAQGQFLTLTVSHQAASGQPGDVSFGISSPAQITLQLFEDLTPITASKIEGFVQSGFFNGKNFHRVASGFPTPSSYIVQGGSASGDGTGMSGLPGTPFANEIVQSLAFTNPGELAMANAGGTNTNDTQFYITTDAPYFLDYNYTLFGQVVSGMNVVNEMTQVATTTNSGLNEKSLPISPINIVSATLSNTNPDGVVHIDTTNARVGETSTITVTATDPSTGTSQTENFQVAVVQNPFTSSLTAALTPIAYGASQSVTVNTPTTIQLGGDPANDSGNPNQTLTYTITNQPANGTISGFNSATGTLMYTPKAGFQGSDSFQFTVTNSGGKLTSRPATVSLTTTTAVKPTASSFDVNSQFGSPTPIQLAGTSSASNQAYVYTIVTQPSQGTVSQFDPSAGTLVYTANPGAQGTDQIQYIVTTVGLPSPGVISATATLTIHLTQPASPGPTPTPTTPSPTPAPSPTPTTPPVVLQLARVIASGKKHVPAIVLTFSNALEMIPAQNLSNYTLVAAGKDRKLGTRDDEHIALKSAVYDAAAHTVTLTPRGALPRQLLRLTVSGAGTLDALGRPIDGTGDGQPGGNAQVTFLG